MQRLHVVGFTKDHEGLILSVRRGTRTGGFTVEVDANFEEVLAELIKERGGEAEPRIPRAESQLSVREMQQRLRSGQSIHQVAKAAGVTDEWVARFAVPIQAEQTQVIRQAFDLTFSKQRLGVSSQPLGVSVWWNLQDKSASLDEEQWENGWSAFLVRDSQWVVKFEYEMRKRRQSAEWEVDLRAGVLTSRNRLATDLGYVESGRRRRSGPPPPMAGGLVTRPAPPAEPPAPTPAPEPEAAPAAAVSKRQAAGRSTAKKAPARKKAATAKKSGANKAPAKKSVAKKSVGKRTAVKKAPAKKPAAKKVGSKKTAPKRASAKRAAPRRAGTKKTASAAAGAKKRPPRKAAPRPALPAPAPRPLTAIPSANHNPVRSPVVSAVRAREAVPSEPQPKLTPPPAPSSSRRRLFSRR